MIFHLRTSQNKIKRKFNRNKENFEKKYKDFKNQRLKTENQHTSQGVLKGYNPKFDILNREHILNQNKFHHDEFFYVDKFRGIRNKKREDFFKRNKNGLLIRGSYYIKQFLKK